jgi:hypothetical protein
MKVLLVVSIVRLIDAPGEMNPMRDVALGLGTHLPGRSR